MDLHQKANEYLNELQSIQEQLDAVLNERPTTCPVDNRYLAEWQKFAVHLGAVTSNVRASITSGTITEEEIDALGGILVNLIPVIAGLFRGYVTTLANCTLCESYPTCRLRTRARATHAVMFEDPPSQP